MSILFNVNTNVNTVARGLVDDQYGVSPLLTTNRRYAIPIKRTKHKKSDVRFDLKMCSFVYTDGQGVLGFEVLMSYFDWPHLATLCTFNAQRSRNSYTLVAQIVGNNKTEPRFHEEASKYILNSFAVL